MTGCCAHTDRHISNEHIISAIHFVHLALAEIIIIITANSHVFVPVAIETAGTWNHLAVELTQQLGRRITAVTDDPRETGFLFQRLSVALQ